MDHLRRVIGDPHELQIGRGDLAAGDQRVTDPGEQPGPVLAANQDDREFRNLSGLHQGERLEQLVQGAEPARQDDECLRVLDEDRLAHEEIPELKADLDILVQALLDRQFDAKADGYAVRARGAPVGRFHDPWTAPGDDRVAGRGQPRANPLCPVILGRPGGSPGRPEYRHRRAEFGE